MGQPSQMLRMTTSKADNFLFHEWARQLPEDGKLVMVRVKCGQKFNEHLKR